MAAWEHAATTNPDQIQHWWRRAPYNVGLACGPSGLLVVDLDTPHETHRSADEQAQSGREVLRVLAEQAGEPFPTETYTVATPSGGQHLYFTAPVDRELRCTIGHLGSRIDTRGRGGYVVAAGSVLRDGSYRIQHDVAVAPLPTWIAEALTPVPAGGADLRLPPERAASYIDAIVRDETNAVAQATTGQRHRTLLKAAGTLGRLVGAGELDYSHTESTLHEAANRHIGRDGFTPQEADTTIRAGLAWGIQRPRHITDTQQPPTHD